MTVKIGVPNKGRLNERTVEILRKAGLDLGEDIGRRLYVKIRNQDIEVVFVRAQDIPSFIAAGALDAGITGIDEQSESGHELVKMMDLRFGYCHLAVAVPEASGITDISQIKDGSRIATSFPNLSKRYFESHGKDVQIMVVTGAAEIMPYLGLSDFIVDLVSTGSTLRTNRLREVGTIIESQAAFFSSESALAEKGEEIEEIASSIKSVLAAEDRKYIMADVPKSKLEYVEKLIPGIGGPTVLELAGNDDFVAVHAVIDSDKVFRTIAELKKIGAKGILTTAIERLVE